MSTVEDSPNRSRDSDVDPVDPFADPRPYDDLSSISSCSWAETNDDSNYEGEDVEFTDLLEPLSFPTIWDRGESYSCSPDRFPLQQTSLTDRHHYRPHNTMSRRQSRSSYSTENTFSIPQNFSVPDHRQGAFFDRLDINARNNFRSVIRSIILSEEHSLLERLSLLQDCEISARESNLGIPFSELVSEPLEGLDVTPLMYELIHCEPQLEGTDHAITGLETVLFLIENWNENSIVHGSNGSLAWVVRKSCLRRMDQDSGNRLFQKLRPLIAERNPNTSFVGYDLTISGLPTPGFNAFISLPEAIRHFDNALHSERESFPSRFPPSLAPAWDRKRLGLTPDSKVSIEFLASDRAWTLELGSNSMKISLLDGPSDDEVLVDASLSLVIPEADNGETLNSTLLFRKSRLRPLSAAGVHAIGLSPTFTSFDDSSTIRGFDDPSILHDGMLLLELTVKLESVAPSQSPSSTDKGKAPERTRLRSPEDVIDLCESDDEHIQPSSTQRDWRIIDPERGELVDSAPETQDAEMTTHNSTSIPAVDSSHHIMANDNRERLEERSTNSMSEDEWDAISDTETIDDDLQSGWVEPSLDSDEE